jgi:hypothetical protein
MRHVLRIRDCWKPIASRDGSSTGSLMDAVVSAQRKAVVRVAVVHSISAYQFRLLIKSVSIMLD